MNAVIWDRLYICDFANEVGVINGTTKLVRFWFGRNLCAVNRAFGIGSNNDKMCTNNMFKTISIHFIEFSLVL